MACLHKCLAFVPPCALTQRTSFYGFTTDKYLGKALKYFDVVNRNARCKRIFDVRMTTSIRDLKEAVSDNPDNINYTEYDYIPVSQFTPLSNTNWYGGQRILSATWDGWTATLQVQCDLLEGGSNPISLPVQVQVTSYDNNSFRIRCNPDGPIREVSRGPIVAAQLDWIRSQESGNPSMSYTSGTFRFETKDLSINIANNFRVVVARKRDGMIVMQDDEYKGKSRGLMFVNRQYGTAIATVRRNYRLDPQRKESFYGAGQIAAQYRDQFFIERTGLAMTNYNYDNFGYAQPGVLPPNVPDWEPDYYVPMYFAAPWLIAHGYRGSQGQYSFGWFLDNVSQTYMNTGDTRFQGQADLAYMGSQCGPFDQHFIYGRGDGLEDVVTAFSYLMGKEYKGAQLNKRAVMPPKHVFGYFQAVFGASGLLEENISTQPGDNHIVLADVVKRHQEKSIPLEGLGVDIDVQDNLKVFTTKGEFWTKGKVRSPQNPDPNNKSVFEWAHDQGLVTQTNITCFIKNDDTSYPILKSLTEKNLYTKRDALSTNVDFGQTDSGPDDAYVGFLNYGGGVDTTAVFPDWGLDGVASWWGDNYRDLFDIGLDFVWQDMTVPAMAPHVLGTPIREMPPYDYIANNPSDQKFNWKSYHPQTLVTDMRYENHGREPFVTQRNIHAYTLCESTYNEGIVANEDSLTKFKRSFIISRGGYIGNQHFGGMWTGDNTSDESYVGIMLTNVINMNMSCLPLVGADIGGFGATSDDPSNVVSADLLTRWVQAGCLLPWFRNHYDRWTAYKKHGKNYQEMYMYDDRHVDIMRSCVELRYRWQEVLYTAMYQNAAFGKPVIKSIMMYNGDEQVSQVQNDHFLMGGHDGYRILCAPILRSGQYERNVYLPRGSNWFPYNPDQDDQKLQPNPIEGGRWLNNYSTPISEIPLFVREGTILPVRYPLDGKNKPINTYTHSDPLVFEVFSMSGGDGMLYLDDGGRTTDAENRDGFSVMEVNSKPTSSNSGRLTFSQSKLNYRWQASFYVRVRNVGTVSSLNVISGSSGATIPLDSVKPSNKFDFFTYPEGTYWEDGGSNSVWMKLSPAVMQDSKGAQIDITCKDSILPGK